MGFHHILYWFRGEWLQKIALEWPILLSQEVNNHRKIYNVHISMNTVLHNSIRDVSRLLFVVRGPSPCKMWPHLTRPSFCFSSRDVTPDVEDALWATRLNFRPIFWDAFSISGSAASRLSCDSDLCLTTFAEDCGLLDVVCLTCFVFFNSKHFSTTDTAPRSVRKFFCVMVGFCLIGFHIIIFTVLEFHNSSMHGCFGVYENFILWKK